MVREIDVVVLGSSPTGLYAAREAATAGARVGVADHTAGCATWSRAAAMKHRVEASGIRRWVQQLGCRPVLIPTSDMFIEQLVRHHEELSRSCIIADGYADVAGALLDKATFHGLCQQHGVATPGVWQVQDKSELAALAGSVPFPCILKPVLIHRAREFLKGGKVLLARTREEFMALVQVVPKDVGGWLVQEIIPGRESEITLCGGYVDRGGVFRQVFTGRKLRQYPAGFGSASMVSSRPCEETAALSTAFLSLLGYRGIFGAEFKRDPRDGQLKIIEINPRPTLWFQITHDAGCRIVEACWRDLTGRAPLREGVQDQGVIWRYLLKDIAAQHFYRTQGATFVFPPPDVSAALESGMVRSWPVFSLRDPMPAIAEPVGYVRKAWRRRQ